MDTTGERPVRSVPVSLLGLSISNLSTTKIGSIYKRFISPYTHMNIIYDSPLRTKLNILDYNSNGFFKYNLKDYLDRYNTYSINNNIIIKYKYVLFEIEPCMLYLDVYTRIKYHGLFFNCIDFSLSVLNAAGIKTQRRWDMYEIYRSIQNDCQLPRTVGERILGKSRED